jgi:glycosyltransferase involved in cell wall biosynthesis
MNPWWQSPRRARLITGVIRALLVTNMWPTPARPALGSFVADQARALRETGEVELEVFAFGGGAGDPRAYVRAARALRRAHGDTRFDVVHAHFGLSAWPALAARGHIRAVTLHGTDIVHPRSRALTLAALATQDIVAATSDSLAERVPAWTTRGRPPAILPTGVALDRFAPADRAQARHALGLRSDGRYLLLAADPARPEKRADRARALAAATGAQLLTLGAVAPAEMPHWINAANAVVICSERESFGLSALEALACDVPVLSTPVGVAPEVLRDLPGDLCADFDVELWASAVTPHLDDPDPRVPGRRRVAPYSSRATAERVLAAWRERL